jgi:2',3'-cyclic-nucleotide 2'-phosphodiesterase (5'-nucleotidase family)
LNQLDVSRENAMLLDAGALLFDKSTITAGRQLEQAKINAAGIVEAYNLLDYEAVGISALDLAGGVDFLKELQEKSKFSWLSANIVAPENDRPLFTPFVVKEKAGLRIAVLGLTGSGSANEPLHQENYRLLPWQDLLGKLVAKLRSKADMVILLSSLSPLENEQIGKEFSDIHIIVQAGAHPHNPQPALINNTLLCQTDKQGKYLGQMRINWHKAGVWEDKTNDQYLQKKQEYDRLAWQVKRMEQKGAPETVYKDNPAALKAYQKLAERLKTIESQMLALQGGNGKSGKSTYENAFLEIDPAIIDNQVVEALLQETKKKVNAVGRTAAGGTMLPGYTGSPACLPCHEEIGKRWQMTPHARAYDTLVAKNQQFNANCVPCHVTGVSMLLQDRAISLSLPESMRQVGCETCHGPGAEHAKNPETRKLEKSPAASVCLQCHTPEHDDNFQFEEDRKRVH